MTIFEYILEFIFPRRCPSCGAGVNWGEAWCERCLQEIIHPRYLHHEFDDSVIDAVYTLGDYDKGLRQIIHHIKFLRRKSDYLAVLPLLEGLERWVKDEDIDIVIPVPISEKKRKTRGYNQVDIIFKEFFVKEGIPYVDCLSKKEEEQDMWELTKEERHLHTQSLFYCSDQKRVERLCHERTVLILDDIYTTGNTVEAIAQVLAPYHCKKIKALTLASGA